jgi:hypothetical protein
MMSPWQFFILMLLVTSLAAGWQAMACFSRRFQLCKLARQWEMQFAPQDRLRLANRIAAKIPVPGASNVRVYDLLFDTNGSRHRYVFTVEYGLGVVRGKRRRWRVAGFVEPVWRAGGTAADCNLTLAPQELSLAQSYQHVREALG